MTKVLWISDFPQGICPHMEVKDDDHKSTVDQ